MLAYHFIIDKLGRKKEKGKQDSGRDAMDLWRRRVKGIEGPFTLDDFTEK